MKEHIKFAHNGVKKEKCDKYERLFISKRDLTRHMKTHAKLVDNEIRKEGQEQHCTKKDEFSRLVSVMTLDDMIKSAVRYSEMTNLKDEFECNLDENRGIDTNCEDVNMKTVVDNNLETLDKIIQLTSILVKKFTRL